MSDQLNSVFLKFACYGTRQPQNQIDGKNFSKLCKDCSLFDKKFTAIDADLIFSKVKGNGARKLTYEQFLEAIKLIATKKTEDIQTVMNKIENANGPKTQATRADYVKFHDDASTYTGVYARGGPTNVDNPKDLSSLLNRAPADARGVPLSVSQN